MGTTPSCPKLTALALALSIVAPSLARSEVLRVPLEVLNTIRDDEERPLARSRGGYVISAGEGLSLDPLSPRELSLHAEYEASSAVLIRWGSFNRVLTQIVVGITSGDPLAGVLILVRGEDQERAAREVLRRAGAEISRVEFLRYLADSAWVRDYGPQLLETPADSADDALLLDHRYNRPRPRDDALPRYLSEIWGWERKTAPLIHAGGNIHVFGDGDAFVTDLIVSENPDLSLWRIHAYFLSLAHLRLTIFPSFPSSFDATGHIDMWMLPVRDREVIIGRYRASDGEPHRITETAASTLRERGYRVHRTPAWRSRRAHFTYTNALIFNRLVFLPSYSSRAAEDREALEVFEQAFPGRELVPVDTTNIIRFDGAIHCAVLQLPALDRADPPFRPAR